MWKKEGEMSISKLQFKEIIIRIRISCADVAALTLFFPTIDSSITTRHSALWASRFVGMHNLHPNYFNIFWLCDFSKDYNLEPSTSSLTFVLCTKFFHHFLPFPQDSRVRTVKVFAYLLFPWTKIIQTYTLCHSEDRWIFATYLDLHFVHNIKADSYLLENIINSTALTCG